MRKRLASLDILRGADLFLLLALGPVVRAFEKVLEGGDAFFRQFHHVDWEGFVTWDLIMPLFLFMSGITIPFSMAKYKEGSKVDGLFYAKLAKRFCLLFFLGWIVQGNLLEFSWREFHPFANTLQAIAVGYVVAALLFVHLKPGWQIISCALLFAGYWLVFGVFGGMNLDPEGNIAMVVDKAVLGSHRDGAIFADDGTWRFNRNYQYTWILSSLNFAVTVLLGCFSGQLLKRESLKPASRALWVFVTGVALVAAGLAISPVFPIIKKIWSSSMTLFSGGICFLLIALVYFIVDVKGWNKGVGVLKWFGMNSITAYCIGEVIDFRSVSVSLLHGFSSWNGYPVVIALADAAILTLIMMLLYKRKIFLKV